jgi:urease accessory protein
VLGRHGETGGAISSQVVADGEDGPYLIERLEADASFPGPGVLGAHRVVDSVIALGYRPPGGPGDLVLERPGAVARFLGQHAHESRLDPVWAQWRAALDNTALPEPPRGAELQRVTEQDRRSPPANSPTTVAS